MKKSNNLNQESNSNSLVVRTVTQVPHLCSTTTRIKGRKAKHYYAICAATPTLQSRHLRLSQLLLTFLNYVVNRKFQQMSHAGRQSSSCKGGNFWHLALFWIKNLKLHLLACMWWTLCHSIKSCTCSMLRENRRASK